MSRVKGRGGGEGRALDCWSITCGMLNVKIPRLLLRWKALPSPTLFPQLNDLTSVPGQSPKRNIQVFILFLGHVFWAIIYVNSCKTKEISAVWTFNKQGMYKIKETPINLVLLLMIRNNPILYIGVWKNTTNILLYSAISLQYTPVY